MPRLKELGVSLEDFGIGPEHLALITSSVVSRASDGSLLSWSDSWTEDGAACSVTYAIASRLSSGPAVGAVASFTETYVRDGGTIKTVTYAVNRDGSGNLTGITPANP